MPEVETMVRGLRPAMVGRLLTDVEVLDPFLLDGTTPDEMRRRVAGSRVDRLVRRGKWVVMHLKPSPSVIVIQPRMTGGFFLAEPEKARHIRLILRMGDDQPVGSVWYCDARRLGRIACYANLEEAEAAFGKSHGPDALEIGDEELGRRLSGTSRAIKPALLDQKVLAGIGNIYADEVLYRARVHPEHPADELSRAKVKAIHRAIGEVLAEAIAAEGSSFDAGYRTVLGLEGGFLATNAVHRRQGQPCPGCGRPIVRERIAGLAGRSTYYCPKCQILKRKEDRS